MKVLLNTYPTAFDCPGGGEIQLLKTQEALVGEGAQVKCFDQWRPDLVWPDLIHYFSVYGGSSAFCDFIKFQKKLPLVISPVLWVRGDTSGYPMGEIAHLLKIADILFPNSEVEADALSEVFGVERSKFHVTYNGVDPIFFQEQQPDPHFFRNHFKVDERFFLNVANIEPRKNQIFLARAAAKMKVPVYHFGNIRSADYFKQVQEAGDGYFRHLGYLDHHAPLLRAAYRACDAFVLPSLLETPGLAALEAASMGSKVVLTEVGSTREYFSKYATYVDPQSFESILGGMQEALDGKCTLELKSYVLPRFSWQQTAKQCLLGYQKIINAH